MEPDIDNLIDLSQAKRIVAQLRGRIEHLTTERDTFAHGARLAGDNCVRLEGLLEEQRALVRQLDARVDELVQEAIESDELRDKLAKLLTGTANALKGEPAELHSHSWHDLPDLARAAVEQHGTAAIRAAAGPLDVWWAMIQAQEELAEQPIAADAVVLHFMGSGASTMVTARQLNDMFAAIYPTHPKEQP